MSTAKSDSDKFKPPCPVCHAKEYDLLWDECNDYFSGDKFEVSECKTCGLRRTLPVPSNLEMYYPGEYRGYHAFVQCVLRMLYGRRVRQWHSMFAKPGQILEVGCGPGFMIKLFQELGWEVSGIERNSQAAKAAAEIPGARIYDGGFEDIPERQSYDLIVLFQVLEHMMDPYETLRSCRTRLAENGRIIIGVPNIASWQAQIGENRWFHLDPPRHLFHFSPHTLASTLKEVGLRVSSISYTSWEHDPYGWIQTILNKLGFDYNRLTKVLMRKESAGFHDLLMFGIGLSLGPISVVLALISWICSRGALMTVVVEVDG